MEPSPQKIPLVFFRAPSGSEPVREWLKGLPEVERRAIGKDLNAGAVAMAGGHAIVPPARRRVVGSAHRLADEADRTCADLPFQGALGRAARVHQEKAQDT